MKNLFYPSFVFLEISIEPCNKQYYIVTVTTNTEK